MIASDDLRQGPLERGVINLSVAPSVLQIVLTGNPKRDRLKPAICRRQISDRPPIHGDERVDVEHAIGISAATTFPGPSQVKEVTLRSSGARVVVSRRARRLDLNSDEAPSDIDQDIVGEALIGEECTVSAEDQVGADEMLGSLSEFKVVNLWRFLFPALQAKQIGRQDTCGIKQGRL
jgi:hypothetical protein